MNCKVTTRQTGGIRPNTLALACFALLAAAGAWGHGVDLFASTEGTRIRGTLKYAGGTAVAGAPVHAYAPDGTEIGETRTGDDGRFELTARVRCDHLLVGDAGEGHRGSYTIAASELPESLPVYAGVDGGHGQPAGGDEHGHPHDADHHHNEGADHAHPAGDSDHPHPADESATAQPAGDLNAQIEQTMARQIGPLREQLHGYEKQVRLRDIIGAIGYVFGIAGVIVLVKNRAARINT